MYQLKIFILCFFCSLLFVSGNHMRHTRESKDTINTTDIMTKCNQTFPIKIEYLHDLNTTGSFSDESEKVPMCYVHCYLTKIGVMGEENQINSERAANFYEIEDEDMIDDCNNEMVAASISDSCAKAYFFLRCLMTRAMIDNKNRDEDAVK
ncbi:hypothetical protein PVAND_011631 [Polypedilum vanderplanki]|uniref:Odorant binding protein n=1 Tax=Polypedilum vanderplanki TaxID=319348 RepID=A0A9J6CKR2_POLVA|nr:hypothetical protein PVAND_011631 [Polypedilum vanderplanki]